MSKSSAHDTRDIHHHLVVTASPEAVFAAIADVRGWWWGDLEGDTDRLGAEFTYRYQDLHTSRQRVIEHVPGRRIVWRVESAHLSFVRNPAEWTGTLITFELTPRGAETELAFTHSGLTPSCECYAACAEAWGTLIGESLRARIVDGRAAARGRLDDPRGVAVLGG